MWLKSLMRNKYRYISWIIGFILFVGPFAIIMRIYYYLAGILREPDLHMACFRMPIDWIFSGRIYYIFSYPEMFLFIFAVLITSLILGPVFCGWLCPVGAFSEAISRIIPLPNKYRIQIKDPKITRAIRYGFLTGFIMISILILLGFSGRFTAICCWYCASLVLQQIINGIINPIELEYWFSGSIIVLIFWLIIGGIFTVGGRGWCLFFCPLGALSGIIHKIGSKLGFYRTIRIEGKCINCGKCISVCPMQAIDSNFSIERTLCINCKECISRCPNKLYKMIWRSKNASSKIN